MKTLKEILIVFLGTTTNVMTIATMADGYTRGINHSCNYRILQQGTSLRARLWFAHPVFTQFFATKTKNRAGTLY